MTYTKPILCLYMSRSYPEVSEHGDYASILFNKYFNVMLITLQ